MLGSDLVGAAGCDATREEAPGTQEAYVTFQEERSLETALLLTVRACSIHCGACHLDPVTRDPVRRFASVIRTSRPCTQLSCLILPLPFQGAVVADKPVTVELAPDYEVPAESAARSYAGGAAAGQVRHAHLCQNILL